MMKVLYVGNKIDKIKSGADSVNKRNIDVISLIFRDNEIIFKELAEYNSSHDKLRFYIAGLNSKIEFEIIDILKNDVEIQYIFISQSLIGRLAKKIKQKFGRRVKIITFYHNIEKHYAKEFIKTNGILHYPFYLWASYNESRSVAYSDINIVLNERDNLQLKQNYNTEANLILPATYEDSFDLTKSNNAKHEIDYLFVGTSFFANVEAIRWFIKNVLSNVDGKLTIIGKGMDSFKKEFESDRVTVLGFVEDLSKYYYASKVVIAPILSGGGMKTKIAEALMYGKLILGSKEAFEGYVENINAMKLCSNKEDYINYLKSEEFSEQSLFNQSSRDCFLDNYCNDVIINKLKSIFND